MSIGRKSQFRRAEPAEQATDPLDADDDREEGRRAMQTLVHEGEEDRLAESEDEDRRDDAEHHVPQGRSVREMADPRSYLAQPVQLSFEDEPCGL